MRNDRLVLLTAAACLAGSALVACGIPESSTPEVIEPAPTDLDQSSLVEVEEFLPDTDARTTVENFLKAASGDFTGRNERLAEFTAGKHDFSETADVINLLENPKYETTENSNTNAMTITVTGSVVGTYTVDGQARMNPNPRPYQESFTLERETLQDVWTISEFPQQVTLLLSQFESAYVEAPLYFLATGQDDLLVPDLRWIYGRLDESTERNLKLQWLVQGPQGGIDHSVRSAIPASTVGQIPGDDGVVQIDLTVGETADSGPALADPIAAQIAWSLNLTDDFELYINGEEVQAGTLDDWRDWNSLPSDPDQIGYFIADETIWQYESNNKVSDFSSQHPWVGFSVPGLRQAAVSDGQIAAVVEDGTDSHLMIGEEAANMTTIEDVEGDLRDPQWLDDGRLVVIDDGALTVADTRDGTTQKLAGESVTALAVPLDGRRLAYVDDGRAWFAPLHHDADGNLLFGERKPIGLDITEVTDVAWSSEDYLWVAGNRAGSNEQLFRVSIDNAEIEEQDGTSDFPQIQQIATNPADPLEPSRNRGEPTIVSSGDALYRVHANTLQLLIDDRTGAEITGTAPFTVLE